jgi:hypothetical protein
MLLPSKDKMFTPCMACMFHGINRRWQGGVLPAPYTLQVAAFHTAQGLWFMTRRWRDQWLLSRHAADHMRLKDIKVKAGAGLTQ